MLKIFFEKMLQKNLTFSSGDDRKIMSSVEITIRSIQLIYTAHIDGTFGN